MRHLSAQWWKRAAAAADLVAEDELLTELRRRLEDLDRNGCTIGEAKATLARQLGITVFNLSLVLRGRGQLTDKIAARLGYRRVTRFERIG